MSETITKPNEPVAQPQLEKLDRPIVSSLDEILGVPFKVLDDGFVRVIDYMGSDESIVQAARVSYSKGTKKVREDETLIRYLMRHQHTTPFEMCEIKLHVRVPMDTWRQWIRHRTANVNEYSTRYSIAIDSAQTTPEDEWRMQAVSNRQGSEGFVDPVTGKELTEKERELQKLTREVYEERIARGIAREQARKDLPLSTYTEAYWKIDLHNLLHFLYLRMDEHAQFEIRQYANTIGYEIVAKWCPMAWQSFLDYKVNSYLIRDIEFELIKCSITGNNEKAIELAKTLGWIKEPLSGDEGPYVLKKNFERGEFEERLKKMGVPIPW